ncbi:unnamed protein product [Bursaphelenchus okinawaensis]|uniref:Ig-like domain-containing protein n=1 Tax=Bursaphelenchus okinawaensis TaxID=465554 RepID=A0A811L3M6_9BILA|nr:unnamed protein product [Bursaphelenchus okinawaensis]CAG9115731.1 unnamed protein product [Bursaphelenchus okinawaensis]
MSRRWNMDQKRYLLSALNSDLECEADSERIKNTTCELIPVILPECPDKTNHFDTFHYCMCDESYENDDYRCVKCEAPTGVDRYTPVLSEYPLYTEVTVACEDLVQKHLLGPQRIVCLKGGWSYESMCRWHQCADPQLNGVNFTVRNQALGYTYNFGVILDLFCENADEKLEGNPSMECIAGHSNLQPVKWDRERKPYCKKKFECELRVGNGVLASAEGLMIGESANFACIQPNYVLSNPNPVTCVKKPRLTRSNRCIAQWNAPDYVILNASASFYCELLQECSELKIRWISHQTPGRFKNFRSGNSAFGTIQKVQDGDQGVYTCDVVDFNGELADQITVHLNINHNGTAGTNTNVFGPVSMIEVPNVSIYSPHLDQPVPECIDQQPMQLECLSELHLEQRQSGSIKPISVPWPTVKDNDPNIQISSSLIGLTAQPYTFNGKEKEIRWLSSDQHGNQAACVTKLIVEGVHRVTAC